jgi:hypothetical protein
LKTTALAELSPVPVSLTVLPPWARPFEAQRRTQLTLETLGVAT